jgi:HPt (histidine-containing phosphotransfer) domain-containing protein
MSDRLPPEEPGRRPARSTQDQDRNSQQALYGMLAKIWEKSQNTVAEHADVLKRSLDQALQGRLDEPSRRRAVDSAHKLAGVLGTFGLPRGTELARIAENAFGQQAGMSQVEMQRVAIALEELSSLIQTPDPLRVAASSKNF